jgi:hypothetical protein
MIAREKWQVKTIAVLERVFEERKAQIAKHGEAMRSLPGGTGPDATWIPGLRTGVQPGPGLPTPQNTATEIQEIFRDEYEKATANGTLTRMHLVREELAEAFELEQTDPAFVDEILQVAALCVQWAEYLIDDPISAAEAARKE